MILILFLLSEVIKNSFLQPLDNEKLSKSYCLSL